jgi:tRNA nucleotidyltransferase (CCA-adding enzyme)
VLDDMRRRIARLLDERHALSVRDLAIGGRDVMEVLGIAAGPRVGEELESLLEEVLEDPSLNRRDALLARLRARAEG